MVRKWLLIQPRSNQVRPHKATANGSNWLKCVGPLDGRSDQAERRRRVAIVQAGMPVNFLIREHLSRRSHRPGHGDRGREQHEPYRTRHCPTARDQYSQ